MIYVLTIVVNNDPLANILSPFLIFIASCYVFYGMVLKETRKIHQWVGAFLFLAILAWSCCEFVWGMMEILQGNPEDNIMLNYSYTLTQVLMTISMLIIAYIELKKLNIIQAILDITIFAICFSVILWVFVFNLEAEKANTILSDPIIMCSLILDTLIFAWTSVWYLSARGQKILLSYRMKMMGYLIFIITDYIYYYVYFYTYYNPNSWIDLAYMLSFIFMAIGAFIKTKEIDIQLIPENLSVKSRLHMNKELILIVIPALIFIFKKDQFIYGISLTIAILVYYTLINYTQKNILREELLLIGQKHIAELEERVEERTQEIVKIMNTDYITGLFNRRYFDNILFSICENLNENEQVAVLYIDLNKFKAIRSLYGTPAAEYLLRKIGERMSGIVTKIDGILASYGEDRFVVVIKSNEADKDAVKLADHIINECSEFYKVDGHDIRVTLNIGISCHPLDTSSSDDLVRNSDVAMNQAREQGFNKTMMFDERAGNKIYSRNRLEMKLRRVIFDEEFRLYYQPQVNCEDGSLCGFEVLLRWIDKENQFIPPSDFIPITEENGLIVPLGDWILNKAVKQFREWKDRYDIKGRIAVNVSQKQLIEKDFTKNLFQVIEGYNILPEELEIEITESQELENRIELLKVLENIRDKGVSIAIDDFGTGYSSLHYLKTLPMDRIKIAKELVDHIEEDIYSKSIIQMVISIAKVKGIKVIAEGVETKEQWECLRNLDCDEIQGYYFAKPIPPNEVEVKWLGDIMNRFEE
jgi:diguanylate cyclase (GGDEF)-like protein